MIAWHFQAILQRPKAACATLRYRLDRLILSRAAAAAGSRVLSELAPPALFRLNRAGYMAVPDRGDIDAVHEVRLNGRYGADRADRPRLSPVPLLPLRRAAQ